jgi:hypothetical protein
MKTLIKYRLLQPVVLGFLRRQDQANVLVEPEEGVTLECDGSTIWLVNEKGRHESITSANLMQVPGVVEEITEEEEQD